MAILVLKYFTLMRRSFCDFSLVRLGISAASRAVVAFEGTRSAIVLVTVIMNVKREGIATFFLLAEPRNRQNVRPGLRLLGESSSNCLNEQAQLKCGSTAL